MNAQLSIFDLPTLSDTHNATSSPGLASGLTHSAEQDGQMTARSGPDPVHASLSARQAKEQGLLTSGTYGRTSTGLSRTAALQSSLASRLRARTDLAGSTLYKLTWKDRTTPAGRSIPALRASARRISDSGSGGSLSGYPTPTKSNGDGGQIAKDCSPTGRRSDGSKATVSLNQICQLTGLVDGFSSGLEGHGSGLEAEVGRNGEVRPVAEASEFGGLADSPSIGRIGRRAGGESNEPGEIERSERLRDAGGLAHNNDDGRIAPPITGFHNSEHHAEPRSSIIGWFRPTNGHWRDADWLFCRDGKWRPVEPGTFPLAHGAAARVGRLRGYGNAIVAPAAQAFIEAYLEVETVTADSPTAANDNTSKEMAA